MEPSTILFDGVCNLCNGFVNFVIPRDPHKKFMFGSLQSEAGQELLKAHAYPREAMTTVILLENNHLYSESTAVLKILRTLGGPWTLLYAFILVPKFIRDFMYKLVSRHRYRLFGKREYCRLPTPELKSRFIG